MKKIAILLLILFAYSCSPKLEKPKLETNKKIILPARLEFGNLSDSIPSYKLDAALSIAISQTPDMLYISRRVIDSVASLMREEGITPNVTTLMEFFSADYALISKTSLLVNMIRTDVILKDASRNLELQGKGYDLVNYRKGYDAIKVYDPSILKSFQRAIAAALDDSLLYDSSEDTFRIYPAPTLVVGGLEFIDNQEYYDWNLFDKPEVNSFDAVVNMIDVLRKSNTYIVYDEDSRDAIYNLFGLYSTENNASPTKNEIDALNKLEVEYFIHGQLRRDLFGAEIELKLFRITSQGLKEVNSAVNRIDEDSLIEFKEKIRETAKMLLESNY